MVAAALISAVIGLEQNMKGGYRYQNTFLCGDNKIKRMLVVSLSIIINIWTTNYASGCLSSFFPSSPNRFHFWAIYPKVMDVFACCYM